MDDVVFVFVAYTEKNMVAVVVAETDEEKTYIATKLTPAFVVSGFVSVTSLSIIVAGVLVNFL